MEHQTEQLSGGDEPPDDYDEEDSGDSTCHYCHGTGGDPWNDGVLPCEYCDGEGYQWWM